MAWLGTDTSINSGGLYYSLCAQTDNFVSFKLTYHVNLIPVLYIDLCISPYQCILDYENKDILVKSL